jgi:hypothetical protein
MNNVNIRQAEKRNLLASFFVTLLIGLAFQEMILASREAFSSEGITIETILFGLMFFFIAVRFFVGNLLHLQSENLLVLPGLVWMYDLLAIVAQSSVLVLIGSFVTVQVNRDADVGFLDYVIMLYTIDVLWILSQWMIGRVFQTWRRESVPFAWAFLNFLLIVSFWILSSLIPDIYSLEGLIGLTVLNFIGFVADMVLIDYYDAM